MASERAFAHRLGMSVGKRRREIEKYGEGMKMHVDEQKAWLHHGWTDGRLLSLYQYGVIALHVSICFGLERGYHPPTVPLYE